MTQEELNDYKERVSMYEMFEQKRKRYESEKAYIENGILTITAAYQHDISFYPDKDFEDKIVKAVIEVYENEINRIEKALKAI